MEAADIRRGTAQNAQKPRVHFCHGFLDLLGRDRERGQGGFVEFFGVCEQCAVAVSAHVGNDVGNHRRHIDRWHDAGKDLAVFHFFVT